MKTELSQPKRLSLRVLRMLKNGPRLKLLMRCQYLDLSLSTHTINGHHAPPPTFQPGTLVVQVDAAWDVKTGKCGVGGIYSGEVPVYPHVISEALSHVSSALMAEAIAVHRAVSSAVYSNVRSLAVLSDSLSLINLLKTGGHQPELFGIMFDIYHFVPLFDVISFNFIFRNFNSKTDLVAKSVLAGSVMNSTLGD